MKGGIHFYRDDICCVQAEQLDTIASMTENAAENVIEGNEQIRGVSYAH